MEKEEGREVEGEGDQEEEKKEGGGLEGERERK